MDGLDGYSPSLLAGRRALVTGGGTGIGRAIAEGLARAGADVVIAARRVEPLEEAAAEIEAITGRPVTVDRVDIRDLETVAALAERRADVDLLVNNAGGQFPQKAREFSPNGWRSVIDLNLHGTWNMTQAFGDRMLDGRGGTICNVVATVGRGIPGIDPRAEQSQPEREPANLEILALGNNVPVAEVAQQGPAPAFQLTSQVEPDCGVDGDRCDDGTGKPVEAASGRI